MRKALSVKQFNEYVKSNIKHDPIFQRVYLKGELANIRVNNYHLYFSLKEGSEIVDAVIYYYEDKEINIEFTPGKQVTIKGNLSYNNYSSRLIIVANEIEEEGLSKECLKFLKMKEEFKDKGYFDQANKKPIPKLVKNVGLVTSKDGAAIVDFLAMINSKANDIHIYLAPVKVQGNDAADLISNAINNLDKLDLDVIVITRGGGSNEDLSSFNERKIIESVFNAKTPIISAIGHNIDTTLIDYTSDLSLQTPTEAGSFLIESYIDYEKNLRNSFKHAKFVIDNMLDFRKLSLNLLETRINKLSPNSLINEKSNSLEKLSHIIDKTIKNTIDYNRSKLNNLSYKFDILEKILEIRKKEIEILLQDKNIYSAHSVNVGDEIELKFSDGIRKARITDG